MTGLGGAPARLGPPDHPTAADPLAADDPQGSLRAALATPGEGAEMPAPEEILLAWLLALADGLDPARASGRIIGAVDGAAVRNRRLFDLLREVGQWPAGRLPAARRAPRATNPDGSNEVISQ